MSISGSNSSAQAARAAVIALRLQRAAVSSGILWPVLVVIGAVFLLLCLAMLVVVMGQPKAAAAGNGLPSAAARTMIPANMLEIYRSQMVKRQCPGLSWTIVAAITHLESNDNRNPGISSAGARGASQFMPTTWESRGRLVVNVGPYGEIAAGYGVDGDGDGLADIMNPLDSIPAAARLLCANGGGNPETLRRAVYAYNHAWWYVDGGIADNGRPFEGVIPLAARLADPVLTGESNGSVAAEGCTIVPDPTTGRGCLTPRMFNVATQLKAQGWRLSCWREQLWNPSSDHPKGRGCDVFPGRGGVLPTPVEKASGDALAAQLIAAAPTTGVKYLIWYGQIWTDDAGWKKYNGGGVYDPADIIGGHFDHIHISVY